MRPLIRLSVGPDVLAEMEAAPGLPPLAVSPAALQVAILRLARDAAAMAPPGSRLRFALDPTAGGAILAATTLPASDGLPPVFLPEV